MYASGPYAIYARHGQPASCLDLGLKAPDALSSLHELGRLYYAKTAAGVDVDDAIAGNHRKGVLCALGKDPFDRPTST